MKLNRDSLTNVVRAGRFFGSTARSGVTATGGYGLVSERSRVTAAPGGSVTVGDHLVMGHDALISARGRCVIGDNFFMNDYSRVVAHESITIGDNVLLGSFVAVLDHDHHFEMAGTGDDRHLDVRQHEFDTAPIVIGDNVWLGDKVTVVRGVTIGSNVVVGANSVVTRDLPAGVLAVGSPARVVREL